jgi:hypothetical protein
MFTPSRTGLLLFFLCLWLYLCVKQSMHRAKTYQARQDEDCPNDHRDKGDDAEIVPVK